MKKHFRNLLNKLKLAGKGKKSIIHRNIFRTIRKVTGFLFFLFLLAVSLAIGLGAGFFASLVQDENPRDYEELKRDIYNYEEPSELYFADHKFAGLLRSDIVREEVKLENVSDNLIKAVIAAEDKHFYEHNGIVPKALFRALFQTITDSPVRTGGSTITQQLVKNQILTNEITFERKAKEILLALRIEKFFNKDEILEAYLNVSSFGRNSSGQNIAGVEAAAKGLFGVKAEDLNLPQAAFIAGLPQSPFQYTPFTKDGELKNKEELKLGIRRQKTVLKRMADAGFITEKQYKDALNYDIIKDFIPKQEPELVKYPYFFMESEERAIKVLMEIHYNKDGYTKEEIENDDNLYEHYYTTAQRDLRQNGYKIYTTIDKDIYDKWQEVIKEFKKTVPYHTVKIKNKKTDQQTEIKEPLQTGAMLIENKTGRIFSFIGGIDYETENLNHATQAYRSNGSTMKPLVVYGPAIDMGIASPGTVLADVDLGLKQNGKSWPVNFSRQYYGLTSTRTALTHSYNVSTVYLMQKIMQENPVQYLEKLGIERLTKQDYTNPAIALGGITNGISVEENTNAYAAFANDGTFLDAYMIEKIEDRNGKVVYEHKPDPVKVFSPQAAWLTVDMMRDVVKRGTASGVNDLLNFSTDLAGKTGTTNNTEDLWFVGLNPNVTLGIWMGFDQPDTIPEQFRQMHLSLWAELMNITYETKPGIIKKEETFKMPGGIVKRTYCGVSGLLPSEACLKAGLTLADYFIADYVPAKEDESLIEGKFVTVNGKKYQAYDSTPEEFTEPGIMLNRDYMKKMVPGIKDFRQLIPDTDHWKHIIISPKKLPENGKKPAPVQVSLKNGTLYWKKNNESDIIGYRIYLFKNGKKQQISGHVHAGAKRSYKLPAPGQYAVTAVDIAGNESPLSDIIHFKIKSSAKKNDRQKNSVKSKDDKQKETKKPENDKKSPSANLSRTEYDHGGLLFMFRFNFLDRLDHHRPDP